MESNLYKVAPPKSDYTFFPSTFWHTPDWESSTTNPRSGYIEDKVLFAGTLDEISIHLFPRVGVIRVRSADAAGEVMYSIYKKCLSNISAYIFTNDSNRKQIELFQPTVYSFEKEGFENIRNGEYIARSPRKASSSKTLHLLDILAERRIQVCYVKDVQYIKTALTNHNIYFDEQT